MDDPITATRKAFLGLMAVFVVIGGIAYLSARGDEAGTLTLNRVAAVSAIAGVCCLLIADLMSIWRREDDNAQMQPPSQSSHSGGPRRTSRTVVMASALFVFRPKEYREAVEQDRKDQEAAEKEAQEQRDRQRQREEQMRREADARESWLFRGHCLVVIAAIFVAVGAFLTSSDSETNESEPSPTESPEPSVTPTGA